MRAIDLVVSEAAHLLVSDLREALDAESERGRPEPCGALEILVAFIVIDVDAVCLLDDGRASLQVIFQVGLRMHKAGNVPRMHAVGTNIHGSLRVASVRGIEILLAHTASSADAAARHRATNCSDWH